MGHQTKMSVNIFKIGYIFYFIEKLIVKNKKDNENTIIPMKSLKINYFKHTPYL